VQDRLWLAGHVFKVKLPIRMATFFDLSMGGDIASP
jgi:hypothetical protein